MKNILDYLQKRKYIFKKFEKIDNKILKTRKKIEIYKAVNLKSFYMAIFFYNGKSRFILKNAKEILELMEKLKDISKHNYKKSILMVEGAICSKAKKILEDNGWRIYVIV